MKTIKEWFETLPIDIKDMALKNMYVVRSEEISPDAATALSRGFIWERSPEGDDFWLKHYNQLLKDLK